MTDDRSDRLQSRFDALKAGLEHVLGKDKAFAVACVAELECIQFVVLQALRRVQAEAMRDDLSPEIVHALDEVISGLNDEVRDRLVAFHHGLCEHLALEQSGVIEQSKHFKEIVDDICNRRG